MGGVFTDCVDPYLLSQQRELIFSHHGSFHHSANTRYRSLHNYPQQYFNLDSSFSSISLFPSSSTEEENKIIRLRMKRVCRGRSADDKKVCCPAPERNNCTVTVENNIEITNKSFNLDLGYSTSELIYFNRLIKDEEYETTDHEKYIQKEKCEIRNPPQVCSGDSVKYSNNLNAYLRPTVPSAAMSTEKFEARALGGSCGFTQLPLQRYKYEDLGLSDVFVEKKIHQFKNSQEFRRTRDCPNPSVVNAIKEKLSQKTRELTKKPQKGKDDIILSIPNLETRIHKALYFNSKELLITNQKLLSIPEDSVIFDGELLKINSTKNGYKKVIRYFQLTKTELKYYNSIFSSSVYNDKPLFRTEISNIARITISNDNMLKFKFNDVKFAFQLYFKNRIQNNASSMREETMIEFGCEDPEFGVSFIKILMLLQKII